MYYRVFYLLLKEQLIAVVAGRRHIELPLLIQHQAGHDVLAEGIHIAVRVRDIKDHTGITEDQPNAVILPNDRTFRAQRLFGVRVPLPDHHQHIFCDDACQHACAGRNRRFFQILFDDCGDGNGVVIVDHKVIDKDTVVSVLRDQLREYLSSVPQQNDQRAYQERAHRRDRESDPDTVL